MENWAPDDVVVLHTENSELATKLLADLTTRHKFSVFIGGPGIITHKYRWAAMMCRAMLVDVSEEMFGVSGAWLGWQLAECLLFGGRVIPIWHRVGPARFRALVEQRMVGWHPGWNSELKHIDDQHLAVLRDVANHQFPRLTEISGCVLEDVTPNVSAFCRFITDKAAAVLVDLAHQKMNVYAIEDTVVRVDSQYKVIAELTTATYGRFYSAIDESDPMEGLTADTPAPMEVTEVKAGTPTADSKYAGPNVAIVVMKNVFANETSARRLIRDLTIMRMLESPFVMHVRDIMTIPLPDKDSFDDVVYVVDHFDSSLHDLIVTGRLLENDSVKPLCYGIIRGLMYIHSAKVVHRDITSKSYMVSMKGGWSIKLAEFGLARPVARDGSITKDGMKLAYRAPEVIVDRLVYGFPMDLWAAGLVMAEIFTGKPFAEFVNDDIANQIEMVAKLTGTPTDEQINRIADPIAKDFIKKLPKHPRSVRAKLVVDATRRVVPDHAQQLIDSLLAWGPSARPSAIQCLKSPYFEDIRQIETELESSVVMPPQFDFEVVRMKSPVELELHLRQLIQAEIALHHLVE